MQHIEDIVIDSAPLGAGLHIQTPGCFCMDVALRVLEFLDSLEDCKPKNTGWKQGFGLKVSAWLPIVYRSSIAEMMTDGQETWLRRASGPYEEFEDLCESICNFLKKDIATAPRY